MDEMKEKTAAELREEETGFPDPPPDSEIKIKVGWKLLLLMIFGGLITGGAIALIYKDFIFAGQMALLTPLLIYLSAVDLKLQMAPDWGTYLTFVLALPGVIYYIVKQNYSGLIDMVAGFVLCLLPMLIAAMVSKGGIGGADIKLMAAVGLFLGVHRALIALIAGLASFVIVNSIRVKAKKVERHQKMALIPYLTFGIVLAAIILN